MLQEARKRGVDLQLTAKFRKADATTELVSIFGEAAFDTVVDTFSLCVMGDEGAKQCLDQLASVVKPGTGKLLLLENSRSSNSILGMYQDVTANAAATMGGKGCVYNQNVAAMIHSTGRLRIEATEQYSAGLFRAFECTRIL
jgi:methyltransferase OMS1